MLAISKRIKALINNRIILIILAFLITALIFLLLFSSCSSTKKPQPEFLESNYFQGFVANDPSDANTSSFTESFSSESISVSQPFDESDSISEPAQEPNAYTKMLSGDIYVDKDSSKTEDQTLRPFFDIWVKYLSNEQTELQNINLLGSVKYNEYNSYTIYYACYSYKANSKENHVALVYASFKSNPNRYILVDAKIIDYEVYDMNFEEINSIISSHNTFKTYVNEQPIVSLENGLKKIDMQNIIGKDHILYSIIPVKDDVVAIFSSKDNTIKVDQFDIATGKLTGESYILTQVRNTDIQQNSCYYFKQSDSVYYMFFEIFDDVSKDAVYKVVFGDNGKITDTVTILSSDERYNYYDKIASLRSESGRYEVFYKDNNIYLLDTVKKSSTLVYKYDESCGIGVAFNFFDGEVLYYSTYEEESTSGIGRYNPVTKENIYCTGTNYSWLLTKDEYVYAYDDDYTQNTVLRFKKDSFKADTPLKPEMKVTSTGSCFSYFNYTKDRECIAQIMSRAVYSSIFLSSDKFAVVLYDTDTLTQLRNYELPPASGYYWQSEFTKNYGIIYDEESASCYIYSLK